MCSLKVLLCWQRVVVKLCPKNDSIRNLSREFCRRRYLRSPSVGVGCDGSLKASNRNKSPRWNPSTSSHSTDSFRGKRKRVRRRGLSARKTHPRTYRTLMCRRRFLPCPENRSAQISIIRQQVFSATRKCIRCSSHNIFSMFVCVCCPPRLLPLNEFMCFPSEILKCLPYAHTWNPLLYCCEWCLKWVRVWWIFFGGLGIEQVVIDNEAKL